MANKITYVINNCEVYTLIMALLLTLPSWVRRSICLEYQFAFPFLCSEAYLLSHRFTSPCPGRKSLNRYLEGLKVIFPADFWLFNFLDLPDPFFDFQDLPIKSSSSSLSVSASESSSLSSLRYLLFLECDFESITSPRKEWTSGRGLGKPCVCAESFHFLAISCKDLEYE